MRPFAKPIVLVIALIFAATNAFALSAGAAAADPVRPELTNVKFGLLSPSAVNAPLWVAQDGGYFAKYGLDVQIVMMGTAAKTTAALLSGDIEFGTGGVGQALNVVAGGGEMVIVSDMLRQSSFRWFGIQGIEKIEDLRGMKIGVPSLGSSADVEARAILAYHGLEVPKDAQIIGVGGLPEIYAALLNGSVQAGILSAPLSFQAVDSGMNLLATGSSLEEWNIPSGQTKIVTMRGWLTKNRETAELFLKGFLEGLHETLINKDFAVQVISQYTQVDLPTAERAYEDLVDGFALPRAYITEDQVAQIKELLMVTTDNPKLAGTSNSAVLDMSILEQLDRSGFIDGLSK